LKAAGYVPPLDDLERRNAALERLAAQDGVLSVPFGALADPRCCAMVQEHALSTPFDWRTWRAAGDVNIQVDAERRLARLIERRPAIERLKRDLAECLVEHRPFVSVGEEPWADVADDVERMGAEHHAEATEALAGAYRLDQKTLALLAENGLWRVFVARVDGVFAGYCCWMKETNLEEAAPPTMNHGPFYAAPRFARHRLGVKMLNVSRDVLAAEGYRMLRLHHTMRGRGARAGALYEQLGAIEYQREYIWRIGADA
jgi:GNAT superfamily N-acetyltransferase